MPWRQVEGLRGQRLERTGRQEVACPTKVHEVVAIVHPRRLEVGRGMPNGRMPQDRAEAPCTDLAGSDMLVAVGSRRELGLRIVQGEDHQPVEPDRTIDAPEQRVYRTSIAEVVPGAPQMRRIEAEAYGVSLDPATLQASEDCRQLVDRRPEPVPAAGRVLEHDDRATGHVRRLRERLLDGDRDLLDSTLRSGPKVRPDV